MKSTSLPARSFLYASLALVPALAQAHPGHSAFDWTVLPHPGHAGEHALLFILLAVTTVGCVAHWVASRKR